MSQQNKRANTSTSTDTPVKRRRGRPRKEENLVNKDNLHTLSPITPVSDGPTGNRNVEVVSNNVVGNDMVGQSVYGVIEGSFDAGYLVSVRAGNSETLLRGVVFQQGLVLPVTAANDVAPHVKVCKRREVRFPGSDPQSQLNGSIDESKRDNEELVQLDNQSASVTAPKLDDSPKSNPCDSLELQIMPQPGSGLGLENQSAPREEALTVLVGPKMDVQATKDVVLESESEPILASNEINDRVDRVIPQVVDSVPGQNESVQIEIDSSDLELPQNLPMDIIIEKSISPKNDVLQEMESEIKPIDYPQNLEGSTPKTGEYDQSKQVSSENEIAQDAESETPAEDSRKDETFCNKKPASDSANDITEGAFSESARSVEEVTPDKAKAGLEPEEPV